MILGDNILKARTTQKISARKLAKMAGISPSYLSEIEHNKKEPSLSILIKIADALNITLSDIASENNDVLDTTVSEHRKIHILNNLKLLMGAMTIPQFVAKINRFDVSEDTIKYALSGELDLKAGTLDIIANSMGVGDFEFFYKMNTQTDICNIVSEHQEAYALDHEIDLYEFLIKKIKENDINVKDVIAMVDIMVNQKK